MNKTLLALVAIASIAAQAIAAPFTYSRVISDAEQAGIISAVQDYNADAKTAFDAAEAAQKVANPAYVVKTYTPVTVVQYFNARVGELIASYEAQRRAKEAALTPNRTALEQFNALPETEKAKIRTAIATAAAATP